MRRFTLIENKVIKDNSKCNQVLLKRINTELHSKKHQDIHIRHGKNQIQ